MRRALAFGQAEGFKNFGTRITGHDELEYLPVLVVFDGFRKSGRNWELLRKLWVGDDLKQVCQLVRLDVLFYLSRHDGVVLNERGDFLC